MINWKNRFAKIIKHNPWLLDPGVSVLEVGSGNFGIAHYLQRPVTGLEPNFTGQKSEWLIPKIGSIFEIPFEDESFDFVLCLDVMEHLSRQDRDRAIRELIRVARRKVIISCPCGPISTQGEKNLASSFNNLGVATPSWLAEHFQNGLPNAEDILDVIARTGLHYSIHGNESINQHYGGLFLDYFFDFGRRVYRATQKRSPFEAPISASDWDLFYSFIFSIFKDASAVPQQRLSSPISPFTKQGQFKARLYSVDHVFRPASYLGKLTPIYAGPAADLAPEDYLTDIPTNAERLENRRWSELSAIYRVWQSGPYSDVVGFCHYRRLFDFRPNGSQLWETSCSSNDLEQLKDSLYDEKFFETLPAETVVFRKPIKLKSSIWENYHQCHNINDLCHVINYMSVAHPYLSPYVAKSMREHELLGTNLFVAHWPVFNELCEFLFDVLFDFEKSAPGLRASPYQNRDLSFLAERLVHIWLRYKQDNGLEILFYPIFYLNDLS